MAFPASVPICAGSPDQNLLAHWHHPTSLARVGVIALGNVTYAPMIHLTRRVLQSMRTRGLAGPVPKQVPQALTQAAQNLFSLLLSLGSASAPTSTPTPAAPAPAPATATATGTATTSKEPATLAGIPSGSELFADNVLLDGALPERVTAASKFVAKHGPLRFVRCEAETESDGVLIVADAQRGFRIAFSLSVSPPNTIQAYKLPD